MPKISDELREERKAQILTATLECLTKYGYTGTNMRTIAEASGLTKGGLYAYFDSKEAIMLAMAEHFMVVQLSSYEAAPGESGINQLRRILQSMAAATQDNSLRPIQRAIYDLWSFGGDMPSIQAALDERYKRYQGALSRVVRRAQTEGAIRPDVDPGEIASLILAARDGLIIHAIKFRAPIDVTALNLRLNQVLTAYLTQA